MENLRWVARSYSDELPVYVPEAGYLRKGDRIRITDGRFKGVEASVVIQPGVGEREVMVCVDNWMWVPLLRVQPGEYEVISLAEEGKHVYTRLDNSRIQNGLHAALGRHWGDGGVTAIDRELATETLRAYGELQLDSAVMRCKLYSLLLPAYTILGDEERQKSLIGTIVSEPLDKAGAYGIQGLGGCFVRKINGSFHAVVGLPLVETYELLSNFNALREKRDKHDG